MDIKLHFQEAGAGTPLILLHGNDEDATYFKHQVAYFSRAYRVIALDTRGHGCSPRGSEPFTIRQFAEDLLAFLNAHDLGKVDLLGFSDGGNIALVFALAHPERVNKLVLNGANLHASGVKPSAQIPVEVGYRVASFFGRWSSRARKNAELLGLMVNDPHIAAADLAGLHVPTLVLAGTNDMIKESHTRLIYNSLPNAHLAFVEGSHFVANENPKEFNQVVERFLAEA